MTILGRIDIHYPGGRSETYRLGNDAITIGSAPANTVRARSARLAPRHLRFFQSGGAFFLTSLAQGHATTINDTPALANEPQQLPNVAQIRAGDLQIIFNRSSDEPTLAMAAMTEATRPTAAGFRAELEADALQVWQYFSASVALNVTNLEADVCLFRLDTSGLPKEWTSPETLAFSLAGNDAFDLMLQIKPTRRAGSAPGEYPLVISISRLDEPARAVHLVLRVQLGAVSGLSAALDPPRLQSGSPFDLHLLNLGNQELPLKLRANDPKRQLKISLAQDALQLGAGERATVRGVAEWRRRPLLGKRADISFAVLAQAQEPNNYIVALPAAVSVKPVLERRRFAAAVIAVVALVLALAAMLHQPPQPEILSFSASEAKIASGTPVKLTWSSEKAQRFFVEVNRAPVAELSREVSSYLLDTQDYDDPINIALIVRNGEATAIKSLSLNVYQPVHVIAFEADKTSLPRGISGELSIRWRVKGAVQLDIALPAGFETQHETVSGDAGVIVIEGAVADDFQITLTAEDEIGGRTTRALPITIRDPECTPIDDTRLYAGPDSRFILAGYAIQNVSVLAKGRNAAGDWLQVELASGKLGWGFHTNFRCLGFAPDSLRVIGDIPQLPTASGAPTPSLTPSLSPTNSASPPPTASTSGGSP
ncbi:MAG: FHA domain-containing protein [Chloroflexota bacterium]|nr:FHA domain-containing protein [Chloroflexota bacterium]MDE2908282.1 FHA domain-containing protein [Chloroflexota bacterium]